MAALGLLDDEPAGASTSTRSRPSVAGARRPGRRRRARSPSARARGRIVQSGGAVVHVELDPALAERGVILCSLEDAFRDHRELVAQWYSKRLTIDRHKLEAANAAFWSGGAFLYVPRGRGRRGPVRDRLRDRRARASRSTGARWSSARATSDFRVHEYDLAEDFDGRQALHAGAFELYLQDGARCRLAQVQDWGARRGLRRLDALRRRRPRRLLPLAAGAARRAPRAPAPRARGVRARRRHGLPRPVLRRGARAPRRVRRRPARDRPVRRRRALARRGHRRRAARASRA